MTPVEQLRRASGNVEQVCGLLVSPTPDTLDSCSGVLDDAVRGLTSLQAALENGAADPAALAEAWRLQRTIRRAGALLATAADYHCRWRAFIGARTAGYGPDGGPGEAIPSGRVCLRG